MCTYQKKKMVCINMDANQFPRSSRDVGTILWGYYQGSVGEVV